MPVKAPDPREEFFSLVKRMDSIKQPTPEDIDHLRKLVVSTPTLWRVATKTTNMVREQLVEKISNGRTRSLLLAELDKQTSVSPEWPLVKTSIIAGATFPVAAAV
jgi:hypothetical protein